MCVIEEVSGYFKKVFLSVLKNKGVSECVLDEIRKCKNIKRIIVEDAVIQRDLLYWLDRNTTVVLARVHGENYVMAVIACLYIGKIELIRNLYICYLHKNKMVLLSPFPDVEKALLSKIQELEKEIHDVEQKIKEIRE